MEQTIIITAIIGALVIVATLLYLDSAEKNKEIETQRERLKAQREIEFRKRLYDIENNEAEITPTEFFVLKTDNRFEENNFTGIYILHNYNKGMYYVGQSVRVFNRVSNHFTGKGNPDVYFDYRLGDHFTIKMIPLNGSGFNSLDSLERHFIEYYHAFDRGYNKTRGNK